MEVGGIFGLLILIADVWAIVNIAQSGATAHVHGRWAKRVCWSRTSTG